MTNQDVQTGKVKYFNPRKRFGFIIPDVEGDDIFVHYNNIYGEDRNKKLRTGDLVEYFVANDDDGNVKAVGVKLIGHDESAATAKEPRAELPVGNISEADCFPNFDPEAAPEGDLTTIAKTMCVPTLITLKDKGFKAKSPRNNKTYNGQIEIIYDPKDRLLEGRSLHRYLASFARTVVYHEQALEMIYKKIAEVCQPHSLEVVGKFISDGKMESTITVGPAQAN